MPDNNKSAEHRSISARLTWLLIVSTVLVSGLALGYSYFQATQEAQRDFEAKGEQSLSFLTTSLANPVWNIDDHIVAFVGDTFMQDGEYVELKVTDASRNKVIYFKKNRDDTNTLRKMGKIIHQGQVVGNVSFSLSRRHYQEIIRETLINSLILILLVLLAIVVVTKILIREYLEKPFGKLTDIVSHFTDGEYEPVGPSTLYREFLPFWGVLEKMREQILAQVSSLNIEIEDRVHMEMILRESESRLSLHIQNTPLGCISWDTNFICTEWNKSAEEIFGFSADEAIGQHGSKLIIPNAIHEDIDRLYQTLMKQKGGTRNTNENMTKDGRIIICEWYNTPIVGPDGTSIGVASLAQDITTRKNMEKDLNDALVNAEQANQAKSEFLATMSHELRTPLNAVLGFAQMLQYDPRNPLSSAQNNHVDSILEGGSHLLYLVNEILDLAKIEADQTDFSLEQVSTVEIIADCLALTSPLGSTKNIQMINHLAESSPHYIRTDRVRLKQVLLNLISNAIKFNKDGGTVSIDGNKIEDGFFRISVTDTGVGIAEQDFARVFDVFNRLDADPMIAQEGTGIGMTVTKMLVERLAGRIGLESELGVGSTFWIEMPLASNKDVLIWADNLRIGIDAIDKDHQIIIMMLNRVNDRSIDDADLADIIEELIDYTLYHFRREEAVMEVCAYPDLDDHRNIHRNLAAEIGDLADAWRGERDPERLHNLHKYIREWLINHIVNEDSKISPYTKGTYQDIKQALDIIEATNRFTLSSKPTHKS